MSRDVTQENRQDKSREEQKRTEQNRTSQILVAQNPTSQENSDRESSGLEKGHSSEQLLRTAACSWQQLSLNDLCSGISFLQREVKNSLE
jgi:hypothetical protein